MKKYIIFDIDRTIVDSYKPELLSLQEAIEIVTGRKIEETEFQKLTTLTTIEFFKSLNLNNYQIELINKEWERTFAKYKTICFPQIKEIIKKLTSEGYIIGVITSRTKEEFHELDKELENIIKYLKIIVTSDLIKNPKPNKESMDYLCKNLNCTTKDIIYIGDSTIDKEFAQVTGSTFIPACWENTELANEENACTNPLDLITVIANINNTQSYIK